MFPTVLIAGAEQGSHSIGNSLRFRSSASAYLSRTPASVGNQKTWTWSGWVKRGALSASSFFGLFEAYVGQNILTCLTFFSDTLLVQTIHPVGSYNLHWQTSAVFRDTSAWYHIVLAYDTTQASSTNAVKIYVNGTLLNATFTHLAGSYVQNRDSFVNSITVHRIGTYGGLQNYFDGYLAEVNFIDGQALDASAFGEIDGATGVWKPKKYTGTYGTNGFHLGFKDGTSTTTLGHDSSGNGNNWTTNNISLTPGPTFDWSTDHP
jgi:hypothetical protein